MLAGWVAASTTDGGDSDRERSASCKKSPSRVLYNTATLGEVGMFIQHGGRCLWQMLAGSLVVASVGTIRTHAQANAVLYEGARVIVGDASPPLEKGAFLVQNGHIAAIGREGSVRVPLEAAHVD